MKPRYLLYAFRALCRKVYRLALRKPLLVGPVERQMRLSKCKACPHYRPFYMADAKCNICGCILSLKTMFADEVCPDKRKPRWGLWKKDFNKRLYLKSWQKRNNSVRNSRARCPRNPLGRPIGQVLPEENKRLKSWKNSRN